MASKFPPKTDQNFIPRDYQRDVLGHFARGTFKRGVQLWHRRAGKDKTDWTLIGDRAFNGRVGNYAYVFPSAQQGREALWENIDRDGFRTLHHIPPSIWAEDPNNSLMRIRLRNGSTIRVMGALDPNTLRGINPVGVVFSEYSLMSPEAWNVVRPILRENGGWALFNFTPLGKNHAFDLWEMARRNPAWFAQKLTVDDTGVLTEADIQAERDAGMSEEAIQREFYCSFEASVDGAYYFRELEAAREDGRIGRVPYEPALPVITAWDLGYRDATAIWFIQVLRNGEIHLIDYYQASGEGLEHYRRVLQERGYVYGEHFAPHDIEAGELGTGTSRKEVAAQLGLKFTTVPVTDRPSFVQDGIDAVRRLIPRMWIDDERCSIGLNALRSYHKERDQNREQGSNGMAYFKAKPVHDWSSHGADALRTFAIMHSPPKPHRNRMDAPVLGRRGRSAAGAHGWMG